MKLKNYFSLTLIVLMSGCVFAQTSVSGIVTDAVTGSPLIGASVIITGTNTGTATDFDGNFSLDSNIALPWALKISYAGYAPQTIEISASQKDLKIKLPKIL